MSSQRTEHLGPAEKIVETLLNFSEHMVHNRPGLVVPDASTVGVRWSPAAVREGKVYRLAKRRSRQPDAFVGYFRADGAVVDEGNRVLGRYRTPGICPEVAAWIYGQIAEVYKLDNDFAARWASWAFAQDHRDLKVALAAFMLVQDRFGAPVIEGDEVLFQDDDYRAVGEAMCLIRRRDKRDLNPRLLDRIGDLLQLPEIQRINRELGFGRSARSAALGRYPKAVTRWLQHRERNPQMLEGLVRAGFRTTVMKLARRVGYKPISARFFEVLRWKQKQAADGRRTMRIGAQVAAAESWAGMSEAQICAHIVATRPSYKRIVGLLPSEVGVTRAVMAAAVEAGSISDNELIILTPTLEHLDLLDVPVISTRWISACEKVENQRAAHIAQRVQHKASAERLQLAADKALQDAIVEEVRDLRIYVAVDVSASMDQAIAHAKQYLTRFLQGFPLDKLTVAVFENSAREVSIRHPSAAGVEHAFRGFGAGGGTYHASAVTEVFARRPPTADEDALFFFVGDQQEHGTFTSAVRASGLDPVAFGLLYVPGSMGDGQKAVEATAEELGIPCFRLSEDMFTDAYAVGRTLRHLMASTPVRNRTAKASMVQTILATDLLQKPAWAGC